MVLAARGRERRAAGRGDGRPALPPAGGARTSAACRSPGSWTSCGSGGRVRSAGEAHEGPELRGVRAALRGRPAGPRLPRGPGRPADAGLGVPVPRPRAPSGPSSSRASSAASASRATRSSAATRWPRSRCGAARCSSHDDAGTREETDGLLEALRARLGSHARRDPRPAPLHRRGGRLPHLRRGAALRAAPRPPRGGAGDGRVLRLLRLAGGLRPRAAAAGPHRRSPSPGAAPPSTARRRSSTASRRTWAGSAGPPAPRRSRRRRPALPPSPTAPASARRSLAAKEHIAAGDIFQVVLSRQHTVDCGIDPFTVYRALRMVNPSPYMYFLKDGDAAVAGASPEMLVRVEGRQVETRPIAGTRPRHDGRGRRARSPASCSPTRRSAPST